MGVEVVVGQHERRASGVFIPITDNSPGVVPVNRHHRINMLAAAVALSLVATGAQAAGKNDLHQRNVAQLKQQYNARIASAGIAERAMPSSWPRMATPRC